MARERRASVSRPRRNQNHVVAFTSRSASEYSPCRSRVSSARRVLAASASRRSSQRRCSRPRKPASPRSASSTWNRRPQCLLTWRAATASGGQQAEPVVEARQKLVHPERADAGRGEFQGQRDPVEPAADLGHHRRVAGVEGETRRDGSGPCGEQADGAGFPHRGEIGLIRQVERRYSPDGLTRQPERFLAGGEHT
jgi:hypothetical protein